MKVNFSVVPMLLKREPVIAWKMFRGFWKLGCAWNRPKRNFGCNHFKNMGLLYLKITPLCNLHCVMCGQFGDKGLMKGALRLAEAAATVVPLERYKRLVDEIAGTVPILYVWGGEPFLYPGLMDLAEYAVKKGLFWSCNTNGTFIEENAERIVRDKWSTIFVSLDSFRDVNDAMRGAGSYDKVLRGFAALNRERARQHSNYPFLSVVTTITNQNYQSLEQFVEATRELNLDLQMFNLGTYTNDAIVEKQKVFMKEKFGIEINCLEGYNTGYNEGIDAAALYRTLEKIHDPRFGAHLSPPLRSTRITVPALNPEKIDIYYANLETPVRNHCIVPWCQANINYNGDVHFCADYPDYILGNIKEQSLEEIYNGERANTFRKILHESPGGMFPGCLRCYQNMLFGKKIRGF